MTGLPNEERMKLARQAKRMYFSVSDIIGNWGMNQHVQGGHVRDRSGSDVAHYTLLQLLEYL